MPDVTVPIKENSLHFWNQLKQSISINKHKNFSDDELNREHLIKEWPIAMREKRQYANELIDENKNKLKKDDFKNLSKVVRKKLEESKKKQKKENNCMSGFREKWSNFLSKFDIWKKDMTKIESIYGRGVVAYFIFIKWVTLLNLFNFIIIFGLIIIPRFYIYTYAEPDANTNLEKHPNCCCRNQSDQCNAEYYRNMTSAWENTGFVHKLQNLVQGTGWMEYTAFFYGYYQNDSTDSLPIAYILAILLVLLISLFMIVREASKGIKKKTDNSTYSNIIFGGWDFRINKEDAVKHRQNLIVKEIAGKLEIEKFKKRKINRQLIALRLVLNIIQLFFLIGCGTLVYYVFETSRMKLEELNLSDIERFLYEFLPSITIVCMNGIAPKIFIGFGKLEKYSPPFTLTMLLIRTVFLRMASLIVFCASMYMKIQNFNSHSDKCEIKSVTILNDDSSTEPTSNEIDCNSCWESYVGQQIYRLALTDFATHIIITFFVNFPRAYLAKKYEKSDFIKMLCRQNFDLSKHVLDIVYTQMLCWLGAFYAPILPGMFVIIFFAMFYIKKFTCMVNSEPVLVLHRTSRLKFMVILLIAYIVAVFPVLWTIGEQQPSIVCGPFRGDDLIWTAVTKKMYSLDENKFEWIQITVDYVTTIYARWSLFLILTLCILYYAAIKTYNKHMEIVLTGQLRLELYHNEFLRKKLADLMK